MPGERQEEAGLDTVGGRARLTRLFRPEWGRLALGYALLFFSIALSFTLTIA